MKDRIFLSPVFPKKPTGTGFFSMLFGILFWIFLLILFVISLYATFFGQSLASLLYRILHRAYRVPFWFSLLMTIFLFPVTFFIILISAFFKIIARETI